MKYKNVIKNILVFPLSFYLSFCIAGNLIYAETHEQDSNKNNSSSESSKKQTPENKEQTKNPNNPEDNTQGDANNQSEPNNSNENKSEQNKENKKPQKTRKKNIPEKKEEPKVPEEPCAEVNNSSDQKLPEVSDNEIEPPKPVANISEAQSDGNNLWKGIAAWLMIIAGTSLILYVIISNRKIPRDSDNRYHGSQNIKSNKPGRIYYRRKR